MRSIRLRTKVPGPRSLALCADYPGPAQSSNPVVSMKAHGALVYDVDGNVLIDFACGRLLPTGHTPDHLLETLHHEAETLIALDGLAALSEPAIQLAQALNHAVSPALGFSTQTILFQSGAEAAAYLARVPAARLVRCLDDVFRARPLTVGGEPSQQFIADERGVGFGRTGYLFSFQRDQALSAGSGSGRPAAVMVDGFASGLSLAALIGAPDVIEAVARIVGMDSAVGPSAIACSVALNTLNAIFAQSLVARAGQIGALIEERVLEWLESFPMLEGYSGNGCLWALRIREAFVGRFRSALLAGGLLVRPAPGGVALLPPLMIPEEQLHEALNVVEAALEALTVDGQE